MEQWYVLVEVDVDWKFLVKHKESLYLPQFYCSSCNQYSRYIAAARVPEPPVEEVRELLPTLPVELHREMLEQLFSANYTQVTDIVKQIETMMNVSPDQFFAMEQAIRQVYQMPSSRLICPGQVVGPLLVSARFKPQWDVLYTGGGLYFSRRVGEKLLESGLTGIMLFPVYTHSGKPSEVYEAVVTGYCGLPSLVSSGGDFFQCEVCRQWYLRGDHPLKVRFNPSVWDGSDFFHVEGSSAIYMSEYAYEVLHTPYFFVEVWADFEEMEGAWIYPDFDLEGNVFS